MSRRQRPINLPAPYLKRVWLDRSRVPDADAYPLCLPLFRPDFALEFERPITIIVGENGTGKSTLLEGIVGLDPVRPEDTDHFKLMREFCADPGAFVQSALDGDA